MVPTHNFESIQFVTNYFDTQNGLIYKIGLYNESMGHPNFNS